MNLKNIFLKSKLKNKEEEVIESTELENLDAEGIVMVRGILDLSDTSVKEVMIPRIDTLFISIDSEVDNSFLDILDSGHSRFPVYEDKIDNVVGILYVKDMLKYALKGEKPPIPEIIRSAYFVPESMKLDSLLKEMKQRHIHIAVAVDEYGGVSGIVTMEDILEEIVGDIQDEFDNETDEIIKIEENEWICDARVNLEDLNDILQTDLPVNDFDTLGGFVFDLFGKIPGKYEKVSWKNLVFITHSISGHKIKQVKIVKEPENAENSK